MVLSPHFAGPLDVLLLAVGHPHLECHWTYLGSIVKNVATHKTKSHRPHSGGTQNLPGP